VKRKNEVWTGKKLANDLAKSKDPSLWMTWVEIPLGSVWFGNCSRADVMAIRKSFSHPTCIIYEVKVSRADFHADINRGKYIDYLKDCSQLFFAMPSGLVKPCEVPLEAGLITRSDKGWHVVKAAPRREHSFHVDLLLKLLMKGNERQVAEWRQYDRLVGLEYKGLKEAARVHGIKLAEDISNAAELLERADELRKKVEVATGKSYSSLSDAVFNLQYDIDSMIVQWRYAPEAVALASVVNDMFTMSTRYSAESSANAIQEISSKMMAKIKADKKQMEVPG